MRWDDFVCVWVYVGPGWKAHHNPQMNLLMLCRPVQSLRPLLQTHTHTHSLTCMWRHTHAHTHTLKQTCTTPGAKVKTSDWVSQMSLKIIDGLADGPSWTGNRSSDSAEGCIWKINSFYSRVHYANKPKKKGALRLLSSFSSYMLLFHPTRQTTADRKTALDVYSTYSEEIFIDVVFSFFIPKCVAKPHKIRLICLSATFFQHRWLEGQTSN